MRTTQKGPADAQDDGRNAAPFEEDNEELLERGGFVAGVADCDMQSDVQRRFHKIHERILDQAVRARELAMQEEAVRASNPAMAKFRHKGARRELMEETKSFYNQLGGKEYERLKTDLDKARESIEPTVDPPNGRSSSYVLDLGEKARLGRSVIVVPSEHTPLDGFNPNLWTSVDPKSFVYGDGVFGIKRVSKFTFREWAAYLAEREELEYDMETYEAEFNEPRAHIDEAGDASSVASGQGLSRWRAAQDLQTMQYCMWRRRSYIHESRLFCNKHCYSRKTNDAGSNPT